jgi:hypothetical protein
MAITHVVSDTELRRVIMRLLFYCDRERSLGRSTEMDLARRGAEKLCSARRCQSTVNAYDGTLGHLPSHVLMGVFLKGLNLRQ